MTNPYDQLKDRLKEISNLNKVRRIMAWDTQVMMPPKAARERAEIMATLSTTIHEKKTDPVMGDLIAASEPFATSEWDKRNLMLIREDHLVESCLPADLVHALTTAKSEAGTIWLKSKDDGGWPVVRPALENVFNLVKEASVIKAEALNCSPFDAQLFHNARGNSQALIDPLFALLRAELPPLVQQIVDKQAGEPTVPVYPLTADQMLAIGRSLAAHIGYDPERGRLDRAPGGGFNSSTLNDGRITSRFNTSNPMTSLLTVMHEAGHALYSWNLPAEWNGQPVGAAPDLSLHESQSLIMQRHVGQNIHFIPFLHQLIAQHEPGFAKSVTPDDLIRSLSQVKPSFIRTEADEATYPLHVVVRYEIEKKLFAGDLKINDIPEYWNIAFKDMLGLDVPNDAVGCLQNKHWFKGLFGYFPTYTQGALYAAQMFESIKRDVPSVEQDMQTGNLTGFNDWLNTHIRCWGQFYDAHDLIMRATGEPPTARHFLNHLKTRYLTH